MIWGQLSYGDIYYQPTDVHKDIVVQQNVFEDIERQKCVKTFFENSFGPKLRVQAKQQTWKRNKKTEFIRLFIVCWSGQETGWLAYSIQAPGPHRPGYPLTGSPVSCRQLQADAGTVNVYYFYILFDRLLFQTPG